MSVMASQTIDKSIFLSKNRPGGQQRNTEVRHYSPFVRGTTGHRYKSIFVQKLDQADNNETLKFRIARRLCEEFTGHRRIPSQRAGDVEIVPMQWLQRVIILMHLSPIGVYSSFLLFLYRTIHQSEVVLNGVLSSHKNIYKI